MQKNLTWQQNFVKETIQGYELWRVTITAPECNLNIYGCKIAYYWGGIFSGLCIHGFADS